MLALTPSRRLIATVLLVVSTALSGCFDGPNEPHQGDRGYACTSHDACLSPLLCLTVPDVAFPVCTGSEPEGGACDADQACAWVRDDRGLPLTCQGGVCAFPGQGLER